MPERQHLSHTSLKLLLPRAILETDCGSLGGGGRSEPRGQRREATRTRMFVLLEHDVLVVSGERHKAPEVLCSVHTHNGRTTGR